MDVDPRFINDKSNWRRRTSEFLSGEDNAKLKSLLFADPSPPEVNAEFDAIVLEAIPTLPDYTFKWLFTLVNDLRLGRRSLNEEESKRWRQELDAAKAEKPALRVVTD